MEEVKLPVDKVDIIISEWMGFFLLFEGMLDSVLHARDKFLAAGGSIFPNKARIIMAAITDNEHKQYKFGFFTDNKYGIKMTTMKEHLLK